MNHIRHNDPKTHCRKNQAAGFSLIELLTALMLLGIVTAMIYSVFAGFNRYASSQRKTVKTELDLVNVYWPMTKEIESAGFGVASSGTTTCVQSNAISVSGSEVSIHSTATGDKTLSGAWGYVSGATCSTGITAAESPDNNVLLLGSLDKKYVRKTTVNAEGNLTDCNSTDDSGRIVYWIPSASALECYETRYSLRDYTTDDPAPKTCAPGTLKLSRSAQSTTTTNYQPMLDCVRDLDYRFGCIDASGALTWMTSLSNPLTDCGTAKLRLIKVGLVVQSSEKQTTQVPASITMFEDLSSSFTKTITLTSDQRYYRWKKREQTISLRNLE